MQAGIFYKINFKNPEPPIFASCYYAMLPAYRLKLYRNFKALEVNDFHGIIRYYERLEEDIRNLDQDEYLDCTITYTEALFQTGDYGRHLVMCDHLLEFIIMHNVDAWGGEDIYARVLFRKASTLFWQHEYPRAEHVARELLKLHPGFKPAAHLLYKSLLLQRPDWLFKLRSAAILVLLLSVLTIVAEIFVIKPFFSDYYNTALVVHNIFLGAGLMTILAGESWHWGQCLRRKQRFVTALEKRRHYQA